GLRMPDLSFYKIHYGIVSADAAFEKFLGTLQNYFDADYYVDWNKIFKKIENHRPELHLLSSLCGAQDKRKMARRVLTDYPKVVTALPLLMACRNSVQLLDEKDDNAPVIAYNFPKHAKQLAQEEVEHYVRFLCDSRILTLLERIESVPDYVTGIEVGMDTNGRKNRGGDCGVKAIRPSIEETLGEIPFLQSKEEATFDYLSSQGCVLPEQFHGERWDWAFWVKDEPRRLVVMEINHYGGGGSKLKAIARDYTGRHKSLASAGIGFIWVTDGLGWLKSKNALREAFETITYVVNVSLAKDGLLEWALRRLILPRIKGQKEYAA
ncbi:MAG: DpnII family type II restriction endonuclease, partial [Pyrinomonadaceae bacterium]